MTWSRKKDKRSETQKAELVHRKEFTGLGKERDSRGKIHSQGTVALSGNTVGCCKVERGCS